MSVTIDIEKFQTNWSAIFSEIQRQRNLKVFSAIEPGTAKIPKQQKQQRKPRCSSVSEIESTKQSFKQGSQDDKEANGLKRRMAQPRTRLTSTPCPTIENDKLIQQDSRLTDAACNLSKDEMALLYEDILKPLDMYAIFRHQRARFESSDEMFQ